VFENGNGKHEANGGNEGKAARKTALHSLLIFITFMFKLQLADRMN
jgi:hypothetical protein